MVVICKKKFFKLKFKCSGSLNYFQENNHIVKFWLHAMKLIWSLLQRWLLSLSPREWMVKSLDHIWKPNFHYLNHLFLNKSDISGLPFDLWLVNVYALFWHWFAQTLCNFCTSAGEQKPSGVQWCLLELKSYKMNLLASG